MLRGREESDDRRDEASISLIEIRGRKWTRFFDFFSKFFEGQTMGGVRQRLLPEPHHQNLSILVKK
jgi:hypothetical protein